MCRYREHSFVIFAAARPPGGDLSGFNARFHDTCRVLIHDRASSSSFSMLLRLFEAQDEQKTTRSGREPPDLTYALFGQGWAFGS
eukprot:5198368-Prymnesium_polylepis.1